MLNLTNIPTMYMKYIYVERILYNLYYNIKFEYQFLGQIETY